MLSKALFGQCDNCKDTVSSGFDVPCACIQAYKASFTAALEAEHTEEWQLAEERLSTWPEQRLKVIASMTAAAHQLSFMLTFCLLWHA